MVTDSTIIDLFFVDFFFLVSSIHAPRAGSALNKLEAPRVTIMKAAERLSEAVGGAGKALHPIQAALKRLKGLGVNRTQALYNGQLPSNMQHELRSRTFTTSDNVNGVASHTGNELGSAKLNILSNKSMDAEQMGTEYKLMQELEENAGVIAGYKGSDASQVAAANTEGDLYFQNTNQHSSSIVPHDEKLSKGVRDSTIGVLKSSEISRPNMESIRSSSYEGTGNLIYKEGYYIEHLTGEVEKVTEWKGVSGGHNYNEFKKFFDENGKYSLEEVNKLEHPDIPGIYDLEYRMKVEIKDYTGKGTGEFKDIPKEDKPPYKKTIYDPNTISNDGIIRLGKEAMEEGIKSQRVSQLKSQKNKQIIRGFSSNGLKFEGIRNVDTGEIENFYPVLKFGEK
ncbi:hypothetical protein BBD42_07125 [Paenibacillus sp. BIHB 4019]|uniref:Bacterial EndoU nuclease domain-containing protein n=1 Tax=Paenibacillus sp. BIHB 4019 TaxID=1870819 RepID=A0A1B2DEX1_9BACL|nr:CdiA family toxin C-terminal domain-containing protein [Paenibacillus sp. BIHB 4019]ANY66264.1 hypothetical protein BBD42_07125 [Paenibacillus sp. BIHB 4019]